MKTIKPMACAVLMLLLVACGGSSGGGAGQLAGNYVGIVRFSFTGPGGRFPGSLNAVLVVLGSGQVGFASLQSGGGVTCSSTPPIFLNGNSFSYSYRYGCNIPGVGTCAVVENGSGVVTINAATAQANGVFKCPGGNVSFAATFNGTRQYARGPSDSSGSVERFAKAINRAM
jgi:hypothetical protein